MIRRHFTKKELQSFLVFLLIPRVIKIKDDVRFIVTHVPDENSLSVECVNSPSELGKVVKIFQKELTNIIKNMIDDLDPTPFDNLLFQILNGEKIKWIEHFCLRKKKIGDGGIDFNCLLKITENNEIAWKGHGLATKAIGQIKHQHSAVGTPEIRKLRGAMTNTRTKYGFFISSGGFSGDAYEEADKKIKKIFLFDKEDLAKEIAGSGIGLEKIHLGSLQNIDESWWQEIKTKPP